MDRTAEFNSMLGKNPVAQQTTAESSRDGLENSARSSFNTEAARIGQDIHVAQLKLDELGKRMPLLIVSIYSYSCSAEKYLQRRNSTHFSTLREYSPCMWKTQFYLILLRIYLC